MLDASGVWNARYEKHSIRRIRNRRVGTAASYRCSPLRVLREGASAGKLVQNLQRELS